MNWPKFHKVSSCLSKFHHLWFSCSMDSMDSMVHFWVSEVSGSSASTWSRPCVPSAWLRMRRSTFVGSPWIVTWQTWSEHDQNMIRFGADWSWYELIRWYQLHQIQSRGVGGQGFPCLPQLCRVNAPRAGCWVDNGKVNRCHWTVPIRFFDEVNERSQMHEMPHTWIHLEDSPGYIDRGLGGTWIYLEDLNPKGRPSMIVPT